MLSRRVSTARVTACERSGESLYFVASSSEDQSLAGELPPIAMMSCVIIFASMSVPRSESRSAWPASDCDVPQTPCAYIAFSRLVIDWMNAFGFDMSIFACGAAPRAQPKSIALAFWAVRSAEFGCGIVFTPARFAETQSWTFAPAVYDALSSLPLTRRTRSRERAEYVSTAAP